MSISSSLDGWGNQDIGHDHVHALGFDKTHPVGVVRRTMVDLIRPIEFQDMLRLRRWCSGTSTRWCEIRVRIDGGAGGLIESEAFWININRDTGMPSRLSDDFLDELQRTTDVHRLRWTPCLRPGGREDAERPERPARHGRQQASVPFSVARSFAAICSSASRRVAAWSDVVRM